MDTGTQFMQGFPELYDTDALRSQAFDLYQRCLTDGTPTAMLQFVQEQIAHRPPRTTLMSEVVDHLSLRLQELREQYFEARDRLLYIVHKRYDVDLTPLLKTDPDVYHQLPIDDLISAILQQRPLRPDEETRLRRILKVSHAIAAQVYHDAEMTEQIRAFIHEWLMALTSQRARLQGDDGRAPGERLQ
jgi:hypothetical protein